jgi:hypothetical protein
MTNTDSGTARGADRFDEIEALLRSYPNVTDSQLAELIRWFKKEASAFEVASLASKDATKDGYTRFRKEHIDKFTSRDILNGLAWVLALSGLVALVAYFA